VAALVPALGAVAFILAGEDGGGGGGGGGGAADAPLPHALAPALAHPWLQYTGDISYSLYLVHWPVVVLYPLMMGRAVDGLLADGAMAVAVAVGLAHAYKRGWEDRFRGGGGPAGREAGLVGKKRTPRGECGRSERREGERDPFILSHLHGPSARHAMQLPARVILLNISNGRTLFIWVLVVSYHFVIGRVIRYGR
jgi:peptidoglycan/LPS O-acetylase OafA/YrhL